MHKCILRPDDNQWQTSGMKELIKLCWSIFLRTCSTHPGLSDFEETFEDDEEVVDSTVTNGVFQFLRRTILESNKFSNEVNNYYKSLYISCLGWCWYLWIRSRQNLGLTFNAILQI